MKSLARDSILYAESAILLLPVRLSVRLSHGWISQKQLQLLPCNFHHTIAPRLSSFSGIRFIQKIYSEILTGSPEQGRQTKEGWEKPILIFLALLQNLENGTRYVHSYY